ELRRRDREERGVGLPCNGAREQRLPCPGWPVEKHAVGHPTTEALVAVGRLQEVDYLGELGLRLVDAGYVREHHADLLRINAPGLRATEVPKTAESSAGGRSSTRQKPEERDEQQRGAETEQDLCEHRGAGIRVLRVDLDALSLKQSRQRGFVP